MMERHTGVIINISSAAALHPSLEPHVYSVTKDALNMMTRIMAFDYAHYNIRVNSICPGLVFTKILKQVGEDYVNSIVETIPAKRIGQVQDIANMAIFLASDEASYVNGDVIAVDGGLSGLRFPLAINVSQEIRLLTPASKCPIFFTHSHSAVESTAVYSTIIEAPQSYLCKGSFSSQSHIQDHHQHKAQRKSNCSPIRVFPF